MMKKQITPIQNGGYIIAALMLEKVSGKSWEVLVDDLFNELSIDYYVGFLNRKLKSQGGRIN